MTDTELRRLAEKATRGPWVADRAWIWTSGSVMDRRMIASFLQNDGMGSRSTANAPDVEYVAAASPDVVLGLLDRIKALEVERDDAFDRITRAIEVRDESIRLASYNASEVVRIEAERDDRPAISREDADAFILSLMDCGWAGNEDNGPDADRVYCILRAHAAKGGE